MPLSILVFGCLTKYKCVASQPGNISDDANIKIPNFILCIFTFSTVVRLTGPVFQGPVVPMVGDGSAFSEPSNFAA